MKWISCTDKMPLPYETCIVGRPDEPRPMTAYWTGARWLRDEAKNELHVTHWKPMPPPPSNDRANRPSGAAQE